MYAIRSYYEIRVEFGMDTFQLGYVLRQSLFFGLETPHGNHAGRAETVRHEAIGKNTAKDRKDNPLSAHVYNYGMNGTGLKFY